MSKSYASNLTRRRRADEDYGVSAPRETQSSTQNTVPKDSSTFNNVRNTLYTSGKTNTASYRKNRVTHGTVNDFGSNAYDVHSADTRSYKNYTLAKDFMSDSNKAYVKGEWNAQDYLKGYNAIRDALASDTNQRATVQNQALLKTMENQLNTLMPDYAKTQELRNRMLDRQQILAERPEREMSDRSLAYGLNLGMSTDDMSYGDLLRATARLSAAKQAQSSRNLNQTGTAPDKARAESVLNAPGYWDTVNQMDRPQQIEELMRQGMTEDEALDYIDNQGMTDYTTRQRSPLMDDGIFNSALQQVAREMGYRDFRKQYELMDSNEDFDSKNQYIPRYGDYIDSLTSRYGTYADMTKAGISAEGALSQADLDNTLYESVNGNETAYNFLHSGTDTIADDARWTGGEKYMTDEERNRFNYLWNSQGKEAAFEYLDQLQKYQLDARQSEATNEEWENFTEEHPFVANFASTALKPFTAGASLATQLYDLASTGSINADSAKYAQLNGTNVIRSKTTDMIRKTSGGEGFLPDALDLLYNGGMSALDNIYQMGMGAAVASTLGLTGAAADATTEAVVLGLMSTDAAQTAVLNNIQSGMDTPSAIINGLASGAIEYLTEKIGMDNFFNSLWRGKDLWVSWAKQMMAEGSEEVLSDALNAAWGYIYDRVTGTQQSEWRKAMNNYILENGLAPNAESEAFTAVLGDQLKTAGKDFLMGAVSASFLGGAGTVRQSFNDAINNNRVTRTAQAVIESDQNNMDYTDAATQQALIDEAQGLGATSKAGRKASQLQTLLDTGKTNRAAQVAEELHEELIKAELRGEAKQPTLSDYAESRMMTGTKQETGGWQNAAPARPSSAGSFVPAALQNKQQAATSPAMRAFRSQTIEGASRNFENAGATATAQVVKNFLNADDVNATRAIVDINRLYNAVVKGETLPETPYLNKFTREAAEISAQTDAMKIIPADLGKNLTFGNSLSQNARSTYSETMKTATREGISAENARKAFEEEYNAAFFGQEAKETSILPDEIRRKISEAAKTDRAEYVSDIEKKGFARSAASEVTFDGSKITGDKGVIANVAAAHVIKDGGVSEKVLTTLNQFAKDLQIRVNLIDTDSKYNGAYNLEKADVTIALDSEFVKSGTTDDIIMGTFGHEMTHRLQDIAPQAYETLVCAARDAIGSKEFSRAVGRQLNMNPGIAYNEAVDEVVADFVGSRFATDEAYADKLLRNITTTTVENPQQLNRLRQWIRKVIDWIRGNKAIENTEKTISSLQKVDAALTNLYEHARSNIEKAISTEAKMELENFGVAVKDGAISKFSLKTWTETDKTRLDSDLKKAGFKAAEINKWINDVNGVASWIAEDTDRLDYIASPVHSFLKANGDYYKKTLDASTLCAKRTLYQGTYDAIMHALPNTSLTSDDVIKLRQLMKSMGKEVPCGICYVESQRKLLGEYAGKWLESYKGEYIPTLDQVVTTDGLEALRTSHPETYQNFVKAMKAKGVQSPKVVELRTEYRQDVKRMAQSTVDYLNRIGGLRVNSFSDFETPHVIDFMQAVMDMSARGLKSMAYTKVPAFGRIFGGTGIKINLSLIPKVDADGNIVRDADGLAMFDEKEGMPIEEALKIRDEYPDDVATIVVGKDMNHVLEMLDDDRVDFVIPFHHSKWSSAEFEQLGLHGFEDFATGHQDNKVFVSEYWDSSKTGKENAERYLELCAERGVKPVFEQLLVDNGDGSYSLQPDGSTDGYWKLIIESKMYNHLTGEGVEQNVVQPNFNMQAAKETMDSYTGDPNKLPVAQDVVDRFVKEYKENHSNEDSDVRYSTRESFAKQVENVLSGEHNPRLDLYVMETPQYLVDIGFSAGPLLMRNSKVKEILKKHPEMDENYIKKIPEGLSEPVLVLASKTHPKESAVIICSIELDDKNNLFVPVWVNQEGTYINVDLQEETGNYNFVASANGRIAKNLIEYAVSHDEVLYQSPDRSRVRQLLTRNGLQLPTPLKVSDSGIRISQSENNSNSEAKEFSNSERFSLRSEPAENYTELAELEAQRKQTKKLLDTASEWRRNTSNIKPGRLRTGVNAVADEYGSMLTSSQKATISVNALKLGQDIINNPKMAYADIMDRANSIASDIVLLGQGIDAVEAKSLMQDDPDAERAVDYVANTLLSTIVSTQDKSLREVRTQLERNEKLKESLDTVRQKRDEKIRLETEKRKEQRSQKRESTLRKDLLHRAKRLENMKLNGANAELLRNLIGGMNTDMAHLTEGKIKKLEDLRAWVSDHKSDPNFYVSDYVQRQLDLLDQKYLDDIVKVHDKGSVDKLIQLNEALKELEHMIRNQNALINENERRDAREAAFNEEQIIRNSRGTREGLLRQADSLVVQGALSPMRFVRRITGYNDKSTLQKLSQDIDDGQRKQLAYELNASKLFDKWMNDKSLVRSITGKKADVISYDILTADGQQRTIKMTKDMRMLLYLASKDNGWMRHMCGYDTPDGHRDGGGISMPDIDLYRKGKIEDAYKGELKYKITKSFLNKVIADMTPQEKAFANQANKFFNTMQKNAINETSTALIGRELATVDNYLPISVNKNFLGNDFGAIKMDGTVDGIGSLKERTDSGAPVYIRGLTDVLLQSIKSTSKYVGLAIPIHNVNKLMKVSLGHFDEDGVYRSHETSLREAINDKWGNTALTYFDKMLTDIQNPVKVTDDIENAFAKMRSNYARSVLTLNLSVGLKQAASYPTAAAVVGWTPLAKAMKDTSKADLDLIQKFTPLLAYRTKGYVNPELGNLRNDSMWDNLPKGLDWITGIDYLTTRKLWKASEYYVRDNQPGLYRKGAGIYGQTDAYYNAVADIYNQVIEETQPNYTPWQRPQYLRSDSGITKTLMMFKTQPMQNFNVLYDAIGNYQAKRAAMKINGTDNEVRAQYKEANKKLRRAISSQVGQLITFAAMTMAWNLFRRKKEKYTDDEGNFSFETIAKNMGKDIGSGIFGMVPFGSDVWSLLSSQLFGDTYYGFESVTDSVIGDLGSAIKTAWDAASEIVTSDGGFDFTKYKKKIRTVGTAVAKLLGVPAENIYNLFTALYMRGRDIFDNKYMAEYYSLAWTEDPSASKSKFYGNLYSAYKDGEMDIYNELRDIMIESGEYGTDAKTPEEDIDEGIKSQYIQDVSGGTAAQGAYDNLYKLVGTKAYDAEYKKMLGLGFTEDDIVSGIKKSVVKDITGSEDGKAVELYDYLYELKNKNPKKYESERAKAEEFGFTEDDIVSGIKNAYGRAVTKKGDDFKLEDLYTYVYAKDKARLSSVIKEMKSYGFTENGIKSGLKDAYGASVTGKSYSEVRTEDVYEYLYNLYKTNSAKFSTEYQTAINVGYTEKAIKDGIESLMKAEAGVTSVSDLKSRFSEPTHTTPTWWESKDTETEQDTAAGVPSSGYATGSSLIGYYEYSNGDLLLYVNGRPYTYHNVPESVYRGFVNSDSKGSYYNKYIK